MSTRSSAEGPPSTSEFSASESGPSRRRRLFAAVVVALERFDLGLGFDFDIDLGVLVVDLLFGRGGENAGRARFGAMMIMLWSYTLMLIWPRVRIQSLRSASSEYVRVEVWPGSAVLVGRDETRRLRELDARSCDLERPRPLTIRL